MTYSPIWIRRSRLQSNKTNPLPGASAALFPEASERIRIEQWLSEELQRALQRIQAGPVVPTLDMNAFRADLGTLRLR